LASVGSDSSYVALHGSTLAVAVEPPATICLWDTRTAQELARLDCDGQQLNSVTFSPDGTRLIATGHDGPDRGRIWEWTIRGRK
jgi:WD40 repeat protein